MLVFSKWNGWHDKYTVLYHQSDPFDSSRLLFKISTSLLHFDHFHFGASACFSRGHKLLFKLGAFKHEKLEFVLIICIVQLRGPNLRLLFQMPRSLLSLAIFNIVCIVLVLRLVVSSASPFKARNDVLRTSPLLSKRQTMLASRSLPVSL